MKVLLGIGGSEDSFRALAETLDRAREAGDSLTVAIVDNPATDVTPESVEARVRAELESADMTAAGLDVDVRRLQGDPGPELVALSDEADYDQLVLGGGERSPMGKIRLGEIAEFVLVNARTTVKLIR